MKLRLVTDVLSGAQGCDCGDDQIESWVTVDFSGDKIATHHLSAPAL